MKKSSNTHGGFTLLEILVSVAILAAITGITFLAFALVTQAWRRGMVLSDDLHHGDFVLEQLVMGLRSAYYRGSANADSPYGFIIEDEGDDPYSSDKISWVKLGGALVGRDAVFAGSPHRIEFYVDEDETGARAAVIRAWRLLGQPEEFDPDEDVEPVFIARKVTGFNCRMKDPESEDIVGLDGIEWIDEWEGDGRTNRLPKIVEITLWMEPLDEGEPPIEMKRVLEIPLAALSWDRGTSSGSSSGTSSGGSATPQVPGGAIPGASVPGRVPNLPGGGRPPSLPGGGRPPGMPGRGPVPGGAMPGASSGPRNLAPPSTPRR